MNLKGMNMNRKTKIICTIGPAVDNEDTMRALIQKMPKSYSNKWLNRLPPIVRLKITQRHIPT